MLNILTNLRVPHNFTYGVLSALYFGFCLGLEKTIVSVLVALCYALMALEAGRSRD